MANELKYTETINTQSEDGTDSDGNKKYKTISIHWTYTYGTVFRIKGDFGESQWEQGFNASMHYTDGVGAEGRRHGERVVHLRRKGYGYQRRF